MFVNSIKSRHSCQPLCNKSHSPTPLRSLQTLTHFFFFFWVSSFIFCGSFFHLKNTNKHTAQRKEAEEAPALSQNFSCTNRLQFVSGKIWLIRTGEQSGWLNQRVVEKLYVHFGLWDLVSESLVLLMETLVVVAQHRNQYYSRSKSEGHARFGSSSPSRDFRGINCRTFQTSSGILPTPLKSYGSPVTKGSSSVSSKTPLTTPNSNSDNKTRSKTAPFSTPVPINDKACEKERTFMENVPFGSLSLSERWAGPTYSNSPPPSSLPIPKFSVRPKRTVSLELPGTCPEIEMPPVANSAPTSPRREHSPSARDSFVNADSATKTLCRILNLNLDDE